MHLKLEKANVLVTGGTKGIGRSIVEHFLEEGANVAFCARTPADVEKAVEDLKGKFQGPSILGTALDIGDSAALKSWVESASEAFGGIDTVVSNVSAMSTADTLESWKKSFKIDLLAAVTLIEISIPILEKSKRSPSIITISSVSGVEIDGTAPGPYGAMKAGLNHYSQQLAFVLAPKGIRVNIVSPGNIWFKGGCWDIEKSNPAGYKRVLANNPLGRLGKPEEIAAQVVLLASPLAGFTSGANMLIDGIEHKGIT